MNFEELDSFLEKMPERGFPAMEVAVAKYGETVYRKCVGFSDSAKTRPTSPSDIYWIFSATKVVTCTAAMQLVESGVISLDDPVSKYLPEFADLKVKDKDGNITDAKNVMTVEHLFTMTGGLSYDLTSLLKAAKEEKLDTRGVISRIPKEPLLFEPGTHYKYSLCHDVLGAIIEVVSGMKLSEYMQKNIFDPLGMKDIGFHPNEEQKSRFSAMYSHRAGIQSCINIPLVNRFTLANGYESGGAGLFSTVDEYMKLITALSLGGTAKNGYRVLSEESVKMMGENRLCDDALHDLVTTRLYGYGWGLCGRAHINPTMSLGRSPVGEFGWDGAAGAFVMVDPINHIALYLGTHVINALYVYHVVHPEVKNMVYKALEQ